MTVGTMSMPSLDTENHTETTSPSSAETGTGPVVFFDGVCGLCNASVNCLLKWDRHGIFRLAPLQGETAQRLLTAADTQQLGSVVLYDEGKTYRKSSAVVRILWRLGFTGKLAGTLLWLIPKLLRDLGYVLVARYRYRWFGKKESCRLPTPAERDRFLT